MSRPATSSAEFNPAYWAHFSPEIQTLNDHAKWDSDPIGRLGAAITLAMHGNVIDKWIMADGNDPFVTMQERISYGFTWVHSILQAPVTVAPGLGLPGSEPYNAAAVPPGSIKVSIDLDDYPPFVAPVAPPPPTMNSENTPVGFNLGGRYYSCNPPNEPTPNGTVITEPRGTFRKLRADTPFGVSQTWIKIG